MARINRISDETVRQLILKSIKGMAINPSERGASARQIQDAMVNPYLDTRLSLLTEINRIVDEINQSLESGLKVQEEIYYGTDEPNTDIYKTWIGSNCIENQNNGNSLFEGYNRNNANGDVLDEQNRDGNTLNEN